MVKWRVPIVLCLRIIFHNSGKMISGQSDEAYQWGGRPWPPWVAGPEASPTSDFIISSRDATLALSGPTGFLSVPLHGWSIGDFKRNLRGLRHKRHRF